MKNVIKSLCLCLVLVLAFFGCHHETPVVVVATVSESIVTGFMTNLQLIASQTSHAVCPSVSPNGQWVAFAGDSEPLASRSVNWDIFVVGSSGGETIQVTHDREMINEENPAWMADSARLVYNSDADNAQLNLWMRPYAGGGGSTKLTSEPNCFFASVSPDGEKIAYTHGAYDPVNYNLLTSAYVTPALLDLNAEGWYTQGGLGRPEIWVMNIKTGERTLLTEGIQPSFCPDGNKIAFTKLQGGKLEIWSIDVDGTHLSRLIGTRGHCMEPCWSPSGRNLVFVSGESGFWKLWAMRGEDNYPVQLTAGTTSEGHPSWGEAGNLFFHSNVQSPSDSTVKWKIWKAKIKL